MIDPNAPIYRRIDPNKTHPYRLKEVVKTLNEQISEIKITGYDILAVRKVYKIYEKPKFYYKPLYATPQYSYDFVKWLIEEYNKNNNFFKEAKEHRTT